MFTQPTTNPTNTQRSTDRQDSGKGAGDRTGLKSKGGGRRSQRLVGKGGNVVRVLDDRTRARHLAKKLSQLEMDNYNAPDVRKRGLWGGGADRCWLFFVLARIGALVG